jgi:hydrogenase nickel incorporation protein HypA/HybF
MHELSIALNIIELAEKESARHGGAVRAVHLKLGPLAGLVKEALASSYELACETSALAGSHLVIEEVPIVVFCPNCRAERTLSSMQLFRCPECNTATAHVVHGRELEVVALELEE